MLAACCAIGLRRGHYLLPRFLSLFFHAAPFLFPPPGEKKKTPKKLGSGRNVKKKASPLRASASFFPPISARGSISSSCTLPVPSRLTLAPALTACLYPGQFLCQELVTLSEGGEENSICCKKKSRRRRRDDVTFCKYRGPTRPSALPIFTGSPPLWSVRTAKRCGTATRHSSPAHVGPWLRVQPSPTPGGCFGAAEQHKSPCAVAAVTSFVWALTASRSWTGRRQRLPDRRESLSLPEPRSKQGSSGLSQGSTVLNNTAGREVEPLTSAAAGHIRGRGRKRGQALKHHPNPHRPGRAGVEAPNHHLRPGVKVRGVGAAGGTERPF